MRGALKAYLSLATGLTEVTRLRAVAAARALVSSGEATAEQVSSLAEDLLSQPRANREAVKALVTFEVDRALGRVGLASADEVVDLGARLRAMEDTVRALRTRLETGAGPGEDAPMAAAPEVFAELPGGGGAVSAGQPARSQPSEVGVDQRRLSLAAVAPGRAAGAAAAAGVPAEGRSAIRASVPTTAGAVAGSATSSSAASGSGRGSGSVG